MEMTFWLEHSNDGVLFLGKVTYHHYTRISNALHPTSPHEQSPSTLPLLHFPLLRFLHPHDLITVQYREGIKGLLQSSHGIDSRLAQLVVEVIPLDKPNSMLACNGPFHLHSTLDHAVNHLLGRVALFVVVQDDR